jgi:D-glycero-alpha-D-manno-heptose 1-phosphate guanylyltransferase
MLTAIILAGGMGTRLRSVVPHVPKPMALVGDRPFIEYQMDYWIYQGVTQFILSLGYKKEVFLNHFGNQYRSIPLIYAVEEEPLGTGGGLLHAAQDLKHPFLVLNGDTFFEVELHKLLDFHQSHRSAWTFTVFRSEETSRYMGLTINKNNEILEFHSDLEGSERIVNGGAYLVDPSIIAATTHLNGQSLSLEDELLPILKHQGIKFFGYESAGNFLDIGLPEDYLKASDFLEKK